MKLLVDTGLTSMCLVRSATWCREKCESRESTDRPLEFNGCKQSCIKVGDLEVTHDIWVADIRTDALYGMLTTKVQLFNTCWEGEDDDCWLAAESMKF